MSGVIDSYLPVAMIASVSSAAIFQQAVPAFVCPSQFGMILIVCTFVQNKFLAFSWRANIFPYTSGSRFRATIGWQNQTLQ